MTKKNVIGSFIKRVNKEIMKLSWIYLIIFSLLVLGLIKLYASFTHTDHDKPREDQPVIEQLKQQVNDQQHQLDSLKKEIEQLKK